MHFTVNKRLKTSSLEDGEDPVKAFSDRAEATAYLERCRQRARAEQEHDAAGDRYELVEMDLPL